eukprot:1151802-Pelagomonas_calceolata.AAC.7
MHQSKFGGTLSVADWTMYIHHSQILKLNSKELNCGGKTVFRRAGNATTPACSTETYTTQMHRNNQHHAHGKQSRHGTVKAKAAV